MADNILVMDHITKEFPGVKALDNVNLEVQRGEIHALIGENGAGKSTLMNVLSGQYPYGSYTGTVTYEGEECKFKNLNDSEAKGIVIIHQELALIPLLSIGENMFLGNEIKNKSGSIDWDRTYSEAEKHMAQVGLHESAQTLIKDIGTGKQQLVEIAKAFSKKVKLLILYEPTSSLNDEDAKMLLDLLMEFKKQGLTSIIITHKLNEIIYCADRCETTGSEAGHRFNGKQHIIGSSLFLAQTKHSSELLQDRYGFPYKPGGSVTDFYDILPFWFQ